MTLQKHTAFPQRKITLIQKGMFVLNTAFVGRYGDVVIILSHLAYSAEQTCFEQVAMKKKKKKKKKTKK